MNSPERTYSPKELSDEWNMPVENVAYHMRELKSLGFVEEVDSAPRRGSVEHYYAPTKRLEAWDVEWGSIPPAIRRTFAASTLRWAVESIGAAIDEGTFEAREDAALAQDSFWTDERGAQEALDTLAKAITDLIGIADAAQERLSEDGGKGFLLSYVLSGFEGSLRPI